MQHCCDEILKRMNRKTTGAELRALVAKLRREIPGITLRTTFITGFPGETEEQFNELGEFAEEMGACAIIRGVRNTTDFEYERTMEATNHRIYPDITTVMLFTPSPVADISSSTVREVLSFGRTVEEFMPIGIDINKYLPVG